MAGKIRSLFLSKISFIFFIILLFTGMAGIRPFLSGLKAAAPDIQAVLKNWQKLAGKDNIITKEGGKEEAALFMELAKAGVNQDGDNKITLGEVKAFADKMAGEKVKKEPSSGIKKVPESRKEVKGLSEAEKKERQEKYEKYMVEISLKNLNHDSMLERYAASGYLYKFYKGGHDREILSFLRNRLISREDIPACFNLIRLLGKIKSQEKETFHVLVNILGQSSQNDEIQIAAIIALGSIGNKDAIPILERHMIWEKRMANRDVLFALMSIAGELRGSKYTLKEVDALAKKFRQDWKQRKNTVEE